MVVTASIVLYKNNRDILLKAIDSFLSSNLAGILYLVDNSPSDELKDICSDLRIVYIFNNKNIGFGKAHNIAIRKSIDSLADYHLILNPDIFFHAAELEKMISYMNGNLDAGLLMPEVRYPNGDLQYLCKRNPKPFDLFARRFMHKKMQNFFKNSMDLYEYKDHDYNKIIFNVPYLSGCFMLFRNSVLGKVGGFDENIFMYIEDADITRRTLAISKTVYFPDATVYHHFEKGSHKNFKLMLYNIHGAFIYFKKWGW